MKNVSLIIAIIEFFTERLYAAVDQHNNRAKELSEKINTLKAEQSANLAEARRAKNVADKIAELIS